MSQTAKRSIEIDFLRGFALIAIALDHIPASVLSHAMLHNFAFCDSAEVFVFVSGYVSAASWVATEARKGIRAANQRFLRRGWEIYAAYLCTAALMLLSGAAAVMLRVDSPLVGLSGFLRFAAHPFTMLTNVALFRDQPYLAGVLPMYVALVLALPLVMPLALRTPDIVLVCSFAIWFASCWLVRYLPAAPGAIWPFNPFAWQAMFIVGLLCRLYPVSHRFQFSALGRSITVLAAALVLTFAYLRGFADLDPQPGYMKQNLASLRIVSFGALAWLAAQAVRLGWIRRLAQRLPGVVNIGQQALVCFVGGAVVSNLVDTLLRAAHVTTLFPARLAGDLLAIGALLTLAGGARRLKAVRPNVALT
ncbi:OpgC domain-containing protein [Paraburkholderia dinghuensis]|uniref:OpgC domain-containing protein n=1 Tax=Paraburkholderia dinghuensis TaxID=2305225 RepID=A0A3N6N035_9BURK|nr:OpgC domain-containing protein [Paraburkholderia dinghuensis]RQH02162.1 OpgC domain-containing protein [Paraburkholderia dinghuensis]